jgi:hypothetical protein
MKMNVNEGFRSQASLSIGLPAIDLHKNKAQINKNTLEVSSKDAGGEARLLDFNMWLPSASEVYRISADPRDYVVVPVPSIVTNIPNTNGDSASMKELTRFQPDYGCQTFRTWVGKPTFEEHANTDVTKAKGVILDVFLRPLPKYPRYAKVVKLLAFDRTKDGVLVNDILTRKIDTYSMGWMYSTYICSVCGAHVGRGVGRPCPHTRPQQPTYCNEEGKLAYRICQSIHGFETSAVRNPAYVSAQSPFVYDLSRL